MHNKAVRNPSVHAGSIKIPKIIQYDHHGVKVSVREDLKGTHREVCLCHRCANFKPGTSANCPIAQTLYQLCARESLVTPVFECPKFKNILNLSGETLPLPPAGIKVKHNEIG